MEKIVAGCLALGIVGVVLVVMIPISIFTNGLVTMLLWRWIVVPVFALAPLTFWQSAGVGLVASALTYQHVPSKDYDDPSEAIGAALANMFLTPGLFLLVGWIISTQV